jgi:hypothetical protein
MTVIPRLGGSPNTAGSADKPLNPPLTAAQGAAAAAALHSIVPPSGFRRYLRYNVRPSHGKAAFVPCLPEPSICFSGEELPRPLTSAVAEALFARLGVKLQRQSFGCQDSRPHAISTCRGVGTFAKYGVGAIIEVTHGALQQLRSGTQVILFAFRIGRPSI